MSAEAVRVRFRNALMLVENLHGDDHHIFRAVAMHALGRPDAIGYLARSGVDASTIDYDVRRFLERRQGDA